MKYLKTSNGIQARILALTLSCVLGMCVLVATVCVYIFRNYMQQTWTTSTESGLQLLSDDINQDLEDVYRMVRFLQTSSNVSAYVEADAPVSPVLAVDAYDSISEQYNSLSAGSNMVRVVVLREDDFLQVVGSTYSSTIDLALQVPSLPYYEELLHDKSYNFSTGFVNDPFHKSGKTVLPILRPITYKFSAKQTGYIFIEVSQDLFLNSFRSYHTAEDSHLILTIADRHYLYVDDTLLDISNDFEVTEVSDSASNIGKSEVRKISSERFGSCTLVSAPLNMNDCYVSQIISQSELMDAQNFVLGIFILTIAGIIAIGIVLLFTLNHMINIPVKKLHARISKISDGDYSTDPSIEWSHELGDIGRGINHMAEQTVLLMNKRLEDEKQKQDLEYKMLLSQVNPHFLYNTLNSIKWMATIQGANGISEMTTALSRLLKSVSKGTSLRITIKEEMALLQDYFTIQSYRYGGTITLDIQMDDEAIYDSEIIKFTLQPLVENAIFHGIEPKGCAGKIIVHGYLDECDNTLCIDVTDNGVGMTAEKAEQVLTSNDEVSNDFFKEVGISNVHKRIQYEFGKEYGITIDSVIGEFTTMSIRLPFTLKKEEE